MIRKNPTSTRINKLAELQSSMQHLCVEAKGTYEAALVKSFSFQPKKLYSHLNTLKSGKSLPLYLQDGDILLFDDAAKANSLNRFFNYTFSTSSSTLPQISDLPTPSSQLHDITFDSFEVYTALNNLD